MIEAPARARNEMKGCGEVGICDCGAGRVRGDAGLKQRSVSFAEKQSNCRDVCYATTVKAKPDP